MPDPSSDEQSRRLTRLEEAVAFVDHTSSQLSAEIAAISREIAALSRRLTALEKQMLDLTDAVTEAPPVVPPPHSAGPDVPKDPL